LTSSRDTKTCELGEGEDSITETPESVTARGEELRLKTPHQPPRLLSAASRQPRPTIYTCCGSTIPHPIVAEASVEGRESTIRRQSRWISGWCSESHHPSLL
jgi:hypothetical protein